MKVVFLVLMVTLVVVTPAVASHVAPSLDQALHASIKRGERTFIQDTGRKWLRARTRCNRPPGETVWRCRVNVSRNDLVCQYRIRVKLRDPDSKVVTRLRSKKCDST